MPSKIPRADLWVHEHHASQLHFDLTVGDGGGAQVGAGRRGQRLILAEASGPSQSRIMPSLYQL